MMSRGAVWVSVAAHVVLGVAASCPVCTCSSPKIWPFSGCNVACGAKCGDQCCCIKGEGNCGGALTCDGCLAAGEAAKILPRSAAISALVEVAIPICEYIGASGWCNGSTPLGDWSCSNLCKGMMAVEADVLFDLLDQHGAHAMCGGAGVCPRPNPSGPVEPAKPVVHSNLSNLAGEKKWSSWDNPTGTFVHFTDLHLQLDYLEGRLGHDCGQPVCCRPEQPKVPGMGAGKYGADGCDLSPAVWAAMVDAMSKLDPRPDFIINTGDDPAHVVWDQTENTQTLHMTNVSQTILNAGFSDVPVIQVLGNHEAHPVNQYRLPLSMDDWLYKGAMETAWGSWIPDDAKRTIQEGGVYTQRLMPGLRGIVMHTTLFETDDWFVAADLRDSQGQMLWLRDSLEQARAAGERVLLLRHHPGDWVGFSDLLRALVEEFSDIIIASFVGHSHTSWFTVVRDKATGTKPLNVEYCPGGSGPDHGTLNPTFRVFKYDLKTFELLDFDQYVFDYRAANVDSAKAFFQYNYSAKAAYGLNDLSAGEWTRLAESWLGQSTEADETWNRYAIAMSRGRSPASSRNRRGEACTALRAHSTPTPLCEADLGLQGNEVCGPLVENQNIADEMNARQMLLEAMMSLWPSSSSVNDVIV